MISYAHVATRVSFLSQVVFASLHEPAHVATLGDPTAQMRNRYRLGYSRLRGAGIVTKVHRTLPLFWPCRLREHTKQSE
jgi:hypothetical protein